MNGDAAGGHVLAIWGEGDRRDRTHAERSDGRLGKTEAHKHDDQKECEFFQTPHKNHIQVQVLKKLVKNTYRSLIPPSAYKGNLAAKAE